MRQGGWVPTDPAVTPTANASKCPGVVRMHTHTRTHTHTHTRTHTPTHTHTHTQRLGEV